jgi:hypothetical protein
MTAQEKIPFGARTEIDQSPFFDRNVVTAGVNLLTEAREKNNAPLSLDQQFEALKAILDLPRQEHLAKLIIAKFAGSSERKTLPVIKNSAQ